jgi:hypothetical protein
VPTHAVVLPSPQEQPALLDHGQSLVLLDASAQDYISIQEKLPQPEQLL